MITVGEMVLICQILRPLLLKGLRAISAKKFEGHICPQFWKPYLTKIWWRYHTRKHVAYKGIFIRPHPHPLNSQRRLTSLFPFLSPVLAGNNGRNDKTRTQDLQPKLLSAYQFWYSRRCHIVEVFPLHYMLYGQRFPGYRRNFNIWAWNSSRQPRLQCFGIEPPIERDVSEAVYYTLFFYPHTCRVVFDVVFVLQDIPVFWFNCYSSEMAVVHVRYLLTDSGFRDAPDFWDRIW